jgi:hypothetical protein
MRRLAMIAAGVLIAACTRLQEPPGPPLEWQPTVAVPVGEPVPREPVTTPAPADAPATRAALLRPGATPSPERIDAPPGRAEPAPSLPAASIEERLRTLRALYDQGLISRRDLVRRRRAILDEL